MGGCRYYDAVRHAAGGRFPSTNYSYWMHQRRYADAALGSVGALVCDEAHDITEQVASFLRTEIRLSEVRAFSPASPWPEPSARLHHWRVWASKAEEALPSADSYAATPEVVRRLRTLLGALGRLQEMPEGAILAQYRDHDDTRVVVEPLWPGHLSREVLFGDAERVVLSSATIRPKTMDLLSIPRSDYDWHEARSPFPVRDRPVIWVKGAGRIDSKSRSWFPGWIRKIDAVIRANQDRKGIIHSVSYARAREIQGASSYGARMLTHERRNAAQVIAEFKAREEPCILVSPIVTTGYDFPGTEAEFNIIPKIPFPVTHGDPVMEARCKADKSYRDYITMVAVVQAVGRVNRYVGDRGMTVILDDHWQWFREKARRHAPDFFWQAESVSSRVPEPLEKL
jgi:Rad3-related DNA helicase